MSPPTELEPDGRRPALLVEVREARRFLPAELAQRMVPGTRITPFPDSRMGMALVDGVVVPVLDLGGGAGDLVLCELGGEPLLLAGLRVLDAGLFGTRDGKLLWQGLLVPELQLEPGLRAVGREDRAP